MRPARSAACVTKISVTSFLAVYFNQQAGQFLRRRAIKRAGRLVGQQQFGLVDQGADDGHALAFPPESCPGR